MFGKGFLLTLFVVWPAMAQFTWYAPDLRWDDDIQTYVGFVNPDREDLTLTITGFGADGSLLGSLERELPANGRFEEASSSFFESATSLAWLRVTSDRQGAGYVRYSKANDNAFSLVPLNHIAGTESWLAQVYPSALIPSKEITLVNTSEVEGGAQIEPHRFQGTFGAQNKVQAIPDFSLAHGQARFQHQDIFTWFPENLSWDRLAAEVPVVGVQHFGAETGGLASQVLQRTPHREFFVNAIQPSGMKAKTYFVAVNTNPDPLEVELISYDQQLNEHPSLMVFEPYERRVFDLSDGQALKLPFHFTWLRLRARENGLIGFQYTAAADGDAMTVTDIGAHAGSVVNLPHTPSTADLRTTVTFLNPDGEKNARFFIFGFADDGQLAARSGKILEGNAVLQLDTEDLFGEKADRVAWMQLFAPAGLVSATATISRRDGSAMAAVVGTPTLISRASTQVSGFELLRVRDLEGQGWTPISYKEAFYRNDVLEETRNIFHDGHSSPIPGQFFAETAHFPVEGQLYLAYEPLTIYKSTIFPERIDRTLLASPFFEVPSFANLYLSYQMRYFNPQNATLESRYGLAWREEGASEWNWFGLGGELLVDPPFLIGDCWIDVGYRDISKLVTLSGWYPFEVQLPNTLIGKRIQVAYFYDHRHYVGSATQGPTLQIDDIRLSTHPSYQFPFYYEKKGSGVFVPDE